jgi:hypothetical protein
MAGAIKSTLAALISMATTVGVLAQEAPYNRDIRDLQPTILDLKGLPSDLNSSTAAHGAKESRLSIKGLGGTRPVAPNTQKNGADNPDGRKLNRRVEFVLPNSRRVK